MGLGPLVSEKDIPQHLTAEVAILDLKKILD